MELRSLQRAHRLALVAGGLQMGGSTTFLVNFAGELVRRGVAVEVLSFERENPLASDFQRQNIPVFCLDERRMIFEDRMTLVMKHLARFKPTAVVSTLGATSFEVLRYVPEGIFRVGLGQSDDPCVYDMIKHYVGWMDLAVMVSQNMEKKVVAMPDFSRVPVTSLPYGVPMCMDSELPTRDFKNPLRLLYLGRLEREQKRVHLFPQILDILQKDGMPFHWTIAGDGKERATLERNLKAKLPQQTLSFCGTVNYDKVPMLLAQHDIFLLASDYEGLPLSLLEAMGWGVVPVVSDLKSGVPEVVDGTNGCLVPVNDVAGYGRAIIRLHNDRVELAAKSVAARERVKSKFSAAAMTDRWLAVLPQAESVRPPWPGAWSIQAPLTAQNPLRFAPALRGLRRAAARLRN